MPHSGEWARREQILAVDLDIGTYTFSSADCVMESISSNLNPTIRITVADQNMIPPFSLWTSDNDPQYPVPF